MGGSRKTPRRTAIRDLVAKPRAHAAEQHRLAPTGIAPFAVWQDAWKTSLRPKNAEMCTVCGLRPVGYPEGTDICPEPVVTLEEWITAEEATERNVCRVCLARRGHRSRKWLQEGLAKTIWADEVADNNGRLALFVGRLDLNGWLDGQLLDTLHITPTVTKNHSPARLYRIAETARTFWHEAVDKVAPCILDHCQRLVMDADLDDGQTDLENFHVYELDVDGVALNVVWDRNNGRLLTAENLDYFVQRWGPQRTVADLAERLKGNQWTVREPSAYLHTGTTKVQVEVGNMIEKDTYLPITELLVEPTLCMVLMPAAHALALARAVAAKYAAEMGRVRDRLPMHIGLVYFPRHTPMRAVLDAGRRIVDLDNAWHWESWRIQKATPDSMSLDKLAGLEQKPAARTLLFANGVEWPVPMVTGDPKVVDQWYPYFLTSQPKQGSAIDPAATRHVATFAGAGNGDGDTVFVRPSYFDFEFLDVTGRRFEITYEGEGGRRPRTTRPFLLDDLDRFHLMWQQMRRMKVSQRYKVVQTIETTRELWGEPLGGQGQEPSPTFIQFVHDTLAGAAWEQGKGWRTFGEEERRRLVTAGAHGELADLLELHAQIMKEAEPAHPKQPGQSEQAIIEGIN